MHFYPNEPFDKNHGQHAVWKKLKDALGAGEGVAYYRYPVFSGRGSQRREPDILVVHRTLGVWILECKGCRIGQIADIRGHEWVMRDWYQEAMTPVAQADDQRFAVKNLVERDRALRLLNIPFECRVVLPFVRKQEWAQAGWVANPAIRGVVWVAEDLQASAVREHFGEAAERRMPSLSDEAWHRLLGIFRGVAHDTDPRPVPTGTPHESPVRCIGAVEERLKVLDEKQERVANEVPEGPQRIRGLAGTGKTVLFARRAAQMHARHPDWDIAFVFYTRSLYQLVRELIMRRFREITGGEEPNWAKLQVWHAWGGHDVTGFYREACRRWGHRFMTFGAARLRLGNRSDNSEFAYVCEQLEQELQRPQPFLDAILIDEGQDLPPAFYRLAHAALRETKRLYWAYDEAQGIGSLTVPTAAEVFGRDRDGKPSIDLSGSYPSGIRKAHNLESCYRTPATILVAAHAVNMGLLRVGGPLQGVSTQAEWQNLGYRVLSGDFSQSSVTAGASVTITREQRASRHPVDDLEGSSSECRPPLKVEICENERDIVQRVVSGVVRDIKEGLRPEDILVVTLPKTRPTVDDLSQALMAQGISVNVAGQQDNGRTFWQAGHVTVASIFRAKGNEAWKIYACGVHVAGEPDVLDAEEELRRRNQVYVALTRARIWCVALGRPGAVVDELAACINEAPRLTFRAFNRASLRRIIEHDGEVEQAPEPPTSPARAAVARIGCA